MPALPQAMRMGVPMASALRRASSTSPPGWIARGRAIGEVVLLARRLEDGLDAGEFLEATADDVAVLRCQLHGVAAPAKLVGGDQAAPRAGERVVAHLPEQGVPLDGAGEQGDWLLCRVHVIAALLVEV